MSATGSVPGLGRIGRNLAIIISWSFLGMRKEEAWEKRGSDGGVLPAGVQGTLLERERVILLFLSSGVCMCFGLDDCRPHGGGMVEPCACPVKKAGWLAA